MIFVTLGTQDKSFERLLVELDTLVDKKEITDEIIVQAGSTKYKSKNMKIFDLIDMNKFDEYISNCDFLITHGGVGSILTGLKNNKKVFAVARLEKYDEHESNHQVEIIEKFDKLGYIVGCFDANEVIEKFKLIKEFKPARYKENNQSFCKLVQKLIDE